MDKLKDRFRGCLVGLACGDAVGTTVEFEQRGRFAPVTDMVGGGPFHLLPGQWTDDTSMALCLTASLLEKEEFDPTDQMNRYCRWRSNGYLSSTGTCFDIGMTVSQALNRFVDTGEAYSGSAHERSAGNGSIMRLAPVPMFYFPSYQNAVYYSGESSKTTHGALECIEACRLFGALIFKALSGENKESILFAIDSNDFQCENIRKLVKGDYRHKSVSEIKGSGYVIECLEAALWCFLHSDSYRDAILKAVNLGDDADTTAAVCGQLAGAYYGYANIPGAWIEKLSKKNLIVEFADRLFTSQVDK